MHGPVAVGTFAAAEMIENAEPHESHMRSIDDSAGPFHRMPPRRRRAVRLRAAEEAEAPPPVAGVRCAPRCTYMSTT